MTSTAASTSRFSINSYVGLGAGLGVPQSALEAVTSLDPKDYQYPTPSLAQRRTAMKQLEHAGVSSILYSSSLLDSHGSMTLEGTTTPSRPAHLDLCMQSEDVGLHSVLNLDLDADCLKLLKGGFGPCGSDSSDRSTLTEEERAAFCQKNALLAAPASPSMTSPVGNPQAEDDDDELLLSDTLSDAVALNQVELSGVPVKRERERVTTPLPACALTNIVQNKIYRDVVPFLAEYNKLHPKKSMSVEGQRSFLLSLDYEAAMLDMNALLESDRLVPEELEISEAFSGFGEDYGCVCAGQLPLKRRRSN